MKTTTIMAKPKDWTFLDISTNQATHGFHQYPARMHPEIAKRLIAEYAPKKSHIVLDPFMGSSGVLVEAMLHGNHSIGIDLNPFAVLISKVKTTPVDPKKLKRAYKRIISKSKSDYSSRVRYSTRPRSDSLNLSFWYKRNVILKLETLKHHIFKISDKDTRDFFKICFSLTSRKTSNQRNSIYKIYRMSKVKLTKFKPDVFTVFENVCTKNISKMEDFVSEVKPRAKAYPILGDSRNLSEELSKIPKKILDHGKVHLVVTSPPYGDHGTTVAYGQFSKHPGLWLDLPEETLFKVDSMGLGGKKMETIDDLGSQLLGSILTKIKRKDKQVAKKTVMPNRVRDVFAFYADLDQCLQQISTILKPNESHCCFVVANRTVRRVTIPTDKIIIQLAKKYGFRHKKTLYRTIANKTMSTKNAPENISDYSGNTMTKESIIIWEY